MQKLTVEVPVIERPHNVDRLVDLAQPERNLISKLGILAIQVDSKVAELLPGLREDSGVIIAARVAVPGAYDSSLNAGDVIHRLNGSPVTSVESLRTALDRLGPETAVALQIERDGKLMFLAFQTQ